MKFTKGEQIAQSRIENVRLNKLLYLDLSGLNLERIPVDISDLTYLLELDLSHNIFWTFPKEIGVLENLQYLNFSHNNLIDIYFEYGRTYNFREIDISNNFLNFVPDELEYLNSNAIISFKGNPFLNNLPPELIENNDLSYIKFYQDSLRTVDNKTRLFETKILLVGRGDVGKTTILNKLLDENFNVEIGKETSTHGINVKSYTENVFFPASYPHYNKAVDFENLYVLAEVDKEDEEEEDDYEGNEVSNDEKILSSTDLEDEDAKYSEYVHIADYFEGVDIPLELIIGNQPSVDFDDRMYFEKEIKVNLWDFGGQEMLYSTHQFFLTKRSIYIFVWDPRTDNDEENFEYWLSIINRLGSESPVLVVMNKCDIRIKTIDENFLKNKFVNIAGFHNISCSTNEGFSFLQHHLNFIISDQKHIGTELPKTWNSIREKLKNCNKDYLTLAEFRYFLETTDSDEISYISGFLRDLGDIIYFGQDYGLKDIIVLNPNWLTSAIYELIHSLEIQKSKGAFNLGQLSRILDLTIYPEERHFQIVTLMEKFEICFQILGSHNNYIIPVLLSPSQPNSIDISEFEVPEALKFSVKYTFLPSGIIERIICRLNFYLEGENYWKCGAVFITEVSRGIIQLDRFRKTILISVIGGLQADLFSIIKHALDAVHSDLKLKDEDFEELYMCNCTECAVCETPTNFPRKALIKFMEKGKEFIQCQTSAEDIKINNILAGFRSFRNENSLLRKFIDAASKLQSRKKMLTGYNENMVNIYFQDLLIPLLKVKNSFAREQSLMGSSSSGKSFGQIDILVSDFDGVPKSIFEGFFLNGLHTSVIDSHFDKTIQNYDANGLNEKFMGVYCKSENFSALALKYSDYIGSLAGNTIHDIEILSTSNVSNYYVQGSEIKVLRTDYLRSGQKIQLYHILINIL